MTDCNRLPLLEQARRARGPQYRGRVVLGPTEARPWTEIRFCERAYADPNEAAGDAQRQASEWYPAGTLAGAWLLAASVRA